MAWPSFSRFPYRAVFVPAAVVIVLLVVLLLFTRGETFLPFLYNRF